MHFNLRPKRVYDLTTHCLPHLMHSIPQTPCKMQDLAIHTLGSYCSTASAFIVIAPQALHRDTGRICNFTTYQTRMWTRAEQFCHAAVNGIDAMWLATSENAIDKMASHKLLTMGDRWLLEVLHVFEGSASNETDKLEIATPLLGLYAELFACQEDVHMDSTSSNQFLSKLLDTIGKNKDSIFPAMLRIDGRLDSKGHALNLGNVRHLLNGVEILPGSVVSLFEDLVPALERLLSEDEDLRGELRHRGLQRRGLKVQAIEQLSKASKAPTRPSRKSTRATRAASRRTVMETRKSVYPVKTSFWRQRTTYKPDCDASNMPVHV